VTDTELLKAALGAVAFLLLSALIVFGVLALPAVVR
jgi:hypothetical protein